MAEEKPVVRKGFGSGFAQACRGGARALAFALALSTGSCAPTIQEALRPAADFQGPHFEGDRFVSFDGARLGLTVWKAEAPPEPAPTLAMADPLPSPDPK